MSSTTAKRQNTELCIEHQPLDEYLINMYALHNAYLLREYLPHDLTSIMPFKQDRQTYHHGLAIKLRMTQHDKQEAAASKKAAGGGTSDRTIGSRKRRRVGVAADDVERGGDHDDIDVFNNQTGNQ
ncbi:hypothetical protein BJ165DRAFT_1608094 [Panaeolus papilionaceus]|nr:hypothetical protein BJ165DRAFT_1608094 [Panaeolus papilionaceus]